MAPVFRASTTWTALEVLSEPYVLLTFRGYTAAIEVLELDTNKRFELLLGGIKSIAEGMEPIRKANGGRFTGMKFRIKKEGFEQTSPYLVEAFEGLSSGDQPRKPESGEESGAPFGSTLEERIWQRITRQHGL
jgi:hypothetical protein